MKNQLGSILFVLLTLGFIVITYLFGIALEFYIGVVIALVIFLVGIVVLWFLPSKPAMTIAAAGMPKKAQNAIVNALIIAGIAGLSTAAGYGFPPTIETLYSTIISFLIAFLTYLAKERGINES
ncbi:MAG: hypothetical protein OEV85_11395 [Candidatus Thorarchaeota archaeon]|nr:hypothetical protein [Candidatus Thorarchaeota archaeon]